jgi:hypothetical protein
MGEVEIMSNIQHSTNELHRCFQLFNSHFFAGDLPEPAITIQTKGKRNAYGWCSKVEFWRNQDSTIKKYEINLTAEHLDRDTADIMRTLLHEMVHLYNAINKVQDCSRNGTFHNKKFKEASERFGFYYDEPSSKKYGWSNSKLKPEIIELIKSWAVDEGAFKIARSVPKNLKKKPNSFKLECPSCGIKLRASKPGIVVMCKSCEIELVEY